MIGIPQEPRFSRPGARILFTTPPSSSDCFMAWIDNFNACTTATGGMSIPTEPSVGNASDRTKICATPACQKLFSVFRSLIDTKCPGALYEVAQFPNGMYTTNFCTAYMPTTPPPTTTAPPPTPPPTTTAPPKTPPPPTTTAPPPPTTAPPPPTTAPPPPTTAAPPSPSPTTGSPMTTTPAPTITAAPVQTDTMAPTPNTTSPGSFTTTTSAPTTMPVMTTVSPPTPPVESVTAPPAATTAPVAASTASKAGVSPTTLATAGGGGFVVLVLVIAIVLLVRRKRSASSNEQGSSADKDLDECDGEAGYTNYSTAPTEDTYTQSGILDGGPLLAGKRIPFRRLRFGDVISQGGFGEVVKGSYNGQVVAIKRLLAARRKDTENTKSFFKEIKLTSTLHHDCLVGFVGYAWDVPSNLCMISQYMAGGDLRTLMATYSKDGHAHGHEDAKLRIAEQVACALQYLHGLKTPVVHRDLKSRNVLLSSGGDAKVIDFGISCERQDYTMTAGVGTKLWMAPEVMLGERYDETADVFSFGVLLSELDTHALPYDHAREHASNKKLNDVKLHELISKGRIYPRFTDRADPDIVALAQKCLQLIPAARPSATDVVNRLIQIRHHDLTNTHTGTRDGTRTDSGQASGTVSHDSVLSFESNATTRSAHR